MSSDGTGRSHPAPYPFGPASVRDILVEGLIDHPDRVAIVDGGAELTWRQLDRAVERVASRLPTGCTAACVFPNSATAIVAALAVWRVGGVWVGIDPRLPADEQRERRQRAGTSVLLTPDVVSEMDITDVADRHLVPDPMSPAAIAFTSGTTGRPKAIVHSQRNLLGPGLVSIEQEPPTDGERIGTALSLSILNMMLLGPISALLRGSTFVVCRSGRADGLVEDIVSKRVTRLFAVPTQLHDLVESDAAGLGVLDRVVVGGGRAEPSLLARFAERFGVRPTRSYGLSEAPTGVARESMADPIEAGRGHPLPHVQIEIRNPAGQRVEVGQVGEVVVVPAVSGPWANTWTPMLGYLDDDEASTRTLRDGALWTGDRGVIDDDGAVTILGRLGDLIVRGGANVDPRAIENAIQADRAVADVAVVGLPHERLGEQVGALIVFAPSMRTPRDLLGWVRARTASLDPHHRVDEVIAADHVPRNAMGKVDSMQVQERFLDTFPA